MNNKQKQKGFTLIELLVVIAIVGLLATVAMVALKNAREKGRDTRRKGDLRQVATALDLYLAGAGAGRYPIQATFDCLGNTSLVAALKDGGLMAALPTDPRSERTSVARGCYNYQSTDGIDYKIRGNLESDATLMSGDGGSSTAWYEIFTPGAQTW